MIIYWITQTPDGQHRLSKEGHWGNIPHATLDKCLETAKADAKGGEYTIKRRRITPAKRQPHLLDRFAP